MLLPTKVWLISEVWQYFVYCFSEFCKGLSPFPKHFWWWCQNILAVGCQYHGCWCPGKWSSSALLVHLLSGGMPQNTFVGKSTLVQLIAWCCQTTDLCLNQCWTRSMWPYGTLPQWVLKKSFHPTSTVRYRRILLAILNNIIWSINIYLKSSVDKRFFINTVSADDLVPQ